jgi:hypothetical protein
MITRVRVVIDDTVCVFIVGPAEPGAALNFAPRATLRQNSFFVRERDVVEPGTLFALGEPDRMRAPRFPLRLEVRYRRASDAEWHRGTSQDISRSGILVHSRAFVELDAPVEIRIRLPAVTPNRDGAEIRCRGRVVRTVARRTAYSTLGFAVAIEDYDFHRQKSQEALRRGLYRGRIGPTTGRSAADDVPLQDAADGIRSSMRLLWNELLNFRDFRSRAANARARAPAQRNSHARIA